MARAVAEAYGSTIPPVTLSIIELVPVEKFGTIVGGNLKREESRADNAVAPLMTLAVDRYENGVVAGGSLEAF
ncbi:hypothetical protein TWF173_010351 [Orbilia oligospora]|nr:hypothetical protein TWF173_010351 [Orbilia oligospora]